MEPERFERSNAGKVIRAPAGYRAFVPNPLPPAIRFDTELIGALSAADRALGELSGLGRTLPNPHLLIRPFIRREAVISSMIEGTQASLSDLFYFEATGREPENRSDVREVANYVIALEYGLKRLESLPISLRLIRELHELLMKEVRGAKQAPGEFRRSQNWIGPPGCSLKDAVFIPPPPDEMMAALDVFEKYLHQETGQPPLIRLACIHYQFEAIHPFLDGNGRIGRLLLTFLLCQWKLLPQPLLYMSAFFEKHRRDYYQLLLAVSQEGRWEEWLRFFLAGVTGMSNDAISRIYRLQQLHQSYRRRFQETRASSKLLALIDLILERPLVSVTTAKEQLNVSYNAAGKYINQLAEAGILSEITGRARYRYYAAGEILAAIDAPLGDRNDA
jgi:Fic family protein